ncbi:hypothetical protein KIV45_17140 [Janthinobacterium lividum]|nr:hypothetical protein KIV45_17140 [Janthinobacterium lividum]
MGTPAVELAPVKLSKELLAGLLAGREYGSEMAKEEEQKAKAAGRLVIFGGSDELMEFRGFVHDERGYYPGRVALIFAVGLLPVREDVEDDDALMGWDGTGSGDGCPGLMIGPLCLHQQPILPQDGKEPIASHFDIFPGKGCTEHAVQLASADARQAQAYRLHRLTTVCALSRHCRSR